jgi:ABC-2 type transport system permease protein
MIAALKYEWRRAITLRSTWWVFLLTAGASSFFTWVMYKTLTQEVRFSDGPQPALPHMSFAKIVNNIAGPYLLVTCTMSVFAAMSWGHEYRYGITRVTFTAFPRRLEVFLSKTIIVVVFTAVMWVGALIPSLLVLKLSDSKNLIRFDFSEVIDGTGLLPSSTGDGSVPIYTFRAYDFLVRSLVYAIVLCLIVAAIASLTRSLPIAVVLALVVPLFVERLLLMLASLGGNSLAWLNDVAPFANGERFVTWTAGFDVKNTAGTSVVQHLTTPWQSGLVFGAWAVALSALAYLLVERRDA